MIRIDIKRSYLYNAIDDLRKKDFECTKSKYIDKIDTFYFGIYLKNDSNNNNKNLDFLYELSDLRKEYRDTREVQQYKGLNVHGSSYTDVYGYRLSEPDLYDVFIADYLPNEFTPRVVVQLRSIGLWLYGEYHMSNIAFEKVKEILEEIEIDLCKENRIDFCYHTNSIQNPYKFFSDERLDRHLKTTLTKYYKIGDIKKNEMTLDYFALGKLRSNNLFNRNYNKAKEVIELQYKPFFFELWKEEKLISQYDYFCYTHAYKMKSYNAIDEGRLKYLLAYTNEEKHKKRITALLDDSATRHEDVKSLADELTPELTTVMNIEFMTKRNFYYHGQQQIELFSVHSDVKHKELKRLFKVLDNREVFLEYITSNTVKYVDESGEYLDFWKRLRTHKLLYNNVHKTSGSYKRIRSQKLDEARKFKQTMNSIAVNSLYRTNFDTGIEDDFSDLLCSINDNDLHVNVGILLVNKETGEILPDKIKNEISEEYLKYKKKKYKLLKNRIEDKEKKKNPKE